MYQLSTIKEDCFCAVWAVSRVLGENPGSRVNGAAAGRKNPCFRRVFGRAVGGGELFFKKTDRPANLSPAWGV